MLETVWQDARYALRTLRRAPGFALVAIGSLAVGIGFAVFIFNFVQQALASTAVPAARTGRLVDVFTSQQGGNSYGTSSYPDVEDIRTRTRVFDDLVAYSPFGAALTVDGVTRGAMGEIVTGNYFRVLGIGVTLGRPLLPADDRPGAPRVVVLSDGMWRRQFGATASVIGRVIRIRNQPYTIVGVAGRGYSSATILPGDFWTSMAWAEDADPVGIMETVPSPGNSRLEQRGQRWLFVKGHLAPGESLGSARAALQALMTQLGTEYPATNTKRQFTALDSRDIRIHPLVDAAIVPASAALAVVVLLVLVVACANVSGLLLARGASRRREMAIRFAVGASRARVVSQLLTESVLIATLGTLAAIGLLWALMVIGRSILNAVGAPFTMALRIQATAFWFGIGLALAAGIASGLAPALRTTGRGRLITQTGTSSIAPMSQRRVTLRDVLIAVQTAAAFILLVTAGLLTRSTLASQGVDRGFRTNDVTVIYTGTRTIGFDTVQAERFYDQALARIRAIPEVQNVALAGRKPLDISRRADTIVLSDRTAPAQETSELVATVSAEYFQVLEIAIVEGRNFSSADTATSPRVAIVTKAFAKRYWPGETAVGKRFHVRTVDGPEYQIVGVCANYKVSTPGEPPTPYIHYATAQNPAEEWTFLIQTRAGAPPPIDRIRRELTTIEPGLLLEAHSMEADISRILLPLEASAVGLSVVGLVTIVFAAIGLYAVVSYMVARRTQEFGVRMAVGASPFQIVSFVIRHGLVVSACGIAIGALAGAAAAVILSRQLFGVTAGDPITWIAALGVVLSVSVAAHAVPARRAASFSPVLALRAE